MGGWRDAVGLTVVSVPQLTRSGVYLRRYGILLVRVGLSRAERAQVLDWALANAVDDIRDPAID